MISPVRARLFAMVLRTLATPPFSGALNLFRVRVRVRVR